MTEKQFRKDVYEAYKLWWMLMHGYTLTDYVNILATADEERRSLGGYPVSSTDKIFDVLVADAEDVGFEGSLWVCEDEFFDTDIYNAGEMESIFSVMWSGEECREFWQETYGSDSDEACEEVIEAETSADAHRIYPTSAGMLRTYPSPDPDQPGFW